MSILSQATQEEQLPTAVGELLCARHLTLSVAESCTGGLLGHLLTNVPGSSDYFMGGVISYSNTAKERLLNVHHATLEHFGAVSEQTAREMAQGVRRLLGTDVSLAVTGIAGPGGGSKDKPVGLVYIALDADNDQRCQRFVWDGTRAENKAHSARAALELLLACLSARLGCEW